jgi:hypothetical protein
MSPRATCLALVLPLLLAGCGVVDNEDFWETERDRLERNAQLWASTAPAHYSFILERVCFCGTEVTRRVRIVVLGGSVTSRTYVDGNQPVSARWHDLFPAMEGIFQIVRDALDRRAAEFEAQYDPDRGYPRIVEIDYLKNAIDEELTIRVAGFSVE